MCEFGGLVQLFNLFVYLLAVVAFSPPSGERTYERVGGERGQTFRCCARTQARVSLLTKFWSGVASSFKKLIVSLRLAMPARLQLQLTFVCCARLTKWILRTARVLFSFVIRDCFSQLRQSNLGCAFLG